MSPSQLQTANTLVPVAVDTEKTVRALKEKQDIMTKYYERGTRDLPVLQSGENVRIWSEHTKSWKPAQIVKAVAPRSYAVTTEHGTTLRRNRIHLESSKENVPFRVTVDDEIPISEPPPAPLHDRADTGHVTGTAPFKEPPEVHIPVPTPPPELVITSLSVAG